MDYKSAFSAAVSQIRDEGRYRVFADLKRHRGSFPRATWTRQDGGESDVVVWCSNDYLGQGQNPVVLDAMHAAIDQHGSGSGGTRNISGTNHHHVELEVELADLHGKEAALLFTSGYVSNEASLSVLYKILPGLIIFSDEQNHASMIAGIRNGGGKRHIFRHNDLAHLEELLAAAPADAPKLVAFESVYSMDGDIADVVRDGGPRQEVRRHDLSRRGPRGRHVRPARRRRRRARRRHGPDRHHRRHAGQGVRRDGRLHHRRRRGGRRHPPDGLGLHLHDLAAARLTAGALASVKWLKQHPEVREAHQERAQTLKAMFKAAGLPVMENDSHIVPVLVGDPTHTKLISDMLLADHGVYVQPINYPTVPRGTERLRFTPTPFHTDEMMRKLVGAMEKLWAHCNVARMGGHAA
jgi:5-aminolevulinate synthase